MAQFDVYENPNAKDSANAPYLLDVQSNFLSDLRSRVVVPLVATEAWDHQRGSRLNPIFRVRAKPCVMLTQQIAGVPIGALGTKIANLADACDEIVGAIDVLITGI